MAKSPPKSADAATESMIQNLKEKTGKTLEQWLKVAAASKLSKHGEIVKHLKTDHGMTHGYANLVALKLLKSDAQSVGTSDELVTMQYSGEKEALRPVYDALIAVVGKFGSDVEVSPKKAYVSVRRSKQFAIIQPSTKSRVDVGINLKGVRPSGRLEASGSFNSMVSHRVKIGAESEVDAELRGWLKAAYDAS